MSLLIALAALTPPPAPHDGAPGSSDRSLAGVKIPTGLDSER